MTKRRRSSRQCADERVICRCKGWAINAYLHRDTGLFIYLTEVCTCVQRKRCERVQRCIHLLPDGEVNVMYALARLLKKPRSRLTVKDKSYETCERFERDAYGKCKPVTIEVRRRRS